MDWASVRPIAPAAVWQLVRHCLARDPRLRLRDIADARLRIDDIVSAPAIEPTGPDVRGARVWLWAGVAVAAVLASAAVAWYYGTRSAPAAPAAQFTLTFDEQSDLAVRTVPSPSPDGRHFIFLGTDAKGVTSIWYRAIESAESRVLPGTEGAQTPIWSPDGAWIAFFADGRLKKVPLNGAQPQTIAQVPGFQDAAWGSGGVIIFRPSNRQPLFRISDTGGDVAPLTRLNEALGENSHRGPTFLPDGRRFLFTSRCANAANNTLYLGSLDSPQLQKVMSAQSKAAYLEAGPDGSGVLLYYRDGGLEARMFDADRNVLGEPHSVIANVDYNSAGIGAAFQAATLGRVIVTRPAGTGGTQLTWFDRSGNQTGTVGPVGDVSQPRLSPAGSRVAFMYPDAKNGNRDVWVTEIDRGITTPVTRDDANDWHPVWSSDGKQILFGSDRGGKPDTLPYMKAGIDVAAVETPLISGFGSPTDWSRDGRWIVVNEYPNQTSAVLIVSAATRTAKRLFDTQTRHGAARFSPDGKWVAYTSEETGRFEVFVRTFANGAAGREKIQISESGGDFPVWRQDGQELFFMSEDATIHAVPTSALRVGGVGPRPQALFRPCPGSAPFSPPMTAQFWGTAFDTLDGKRFLVNCSLRASREYVVLMDWPLAARN
jgi:Tol biopolymer transport system component